MSVRSRIIRGLLAATALVVLLTGVSVTRFVLAHPNYGLQQNMATWARNKGLGFAVDRMEMWLHSKAPEAAPAASLALGDTTDTTLVPGTTTPESTTSSSSTSTTWPAWTTSSTIPGETTTTVPGQVVPPADITPVISPALKGEGQWRVLFTLGKSRKQPVVWAMSTRPFAKYGSVVATAAVFDQTRLSAAMFNGSDVPGGGPWVNSKRIPDRALKSLVAAFNGGFRFEHKPGGYVTEGVEVRKMVKGNATIGIDANHVMHVGVWGDDMHRDDGWVSLRQNLPPLVQDGKVTWTKYKWTDWGTDYGDKMYTYRSGLCARTDGSLMFVSVGDVNIGLLADAMLQFGCSTGMELDINGNWPHFSTYTGFGTTNRYGRTLDTRMGDPLRFINGYEKDFFALFDPRMLPADLLR